MHLPPPETTDEAVVSQAINDPDAYGVIIQRYEQKLRRYIRRVSGLGNEDIEDLLQEVFIKAYQNLRDFDTKRKFSSWIYRIAHNHVMSNFRKLQARPHIAYSLEEADLAGMLKTDAGIVESIDSEQDRERLLLALEEIPEKYREVMVLRYLEEKSYEEIAEIIQRPIGTVGTLINRAHKKCRESIARHQKI